MVRIVGAFFLAGLLALAAMAGGWSEEATYRIAYDSSNRLLFPASYREWIYLSSGVDMNYTPKTGQPGTPSESVFDNVFVNPAAYRRFKETGTWPDKTVLILEGRKAGSAASINKSGHFQTAATNNIEAHVKDEARFPGKWAFFDFQNQASGKLIARPASCYTCHEQHAAVDTTFVQFYPTLLSIAQAKGTLTSQSPQ